MFLRARAATRNDRNRYRGRYQGSQLEVEPRSRSLSIDRGQKNLARTHLDSSLGPLENVEPRRLASVVDPRLVASILASLRLDRQDDTL